MTLLNSDLARLYEPLEKKIAGDTATPIPNGAISLEMHQFDKIDSHNYHALFTMNRPSTVAEICNRITDLASGNFVAIPETITRVPASIGYMFRTVVRANSISRPLENEDKIVTKDTAYDASGQVWRIEGEGENRRLVKDAVDDLAEILESRRSHRTVQTYKKLDIAEFNNGDCAAWVDCSSGNVKTGTLYHTLEGTIGITFDGAQMNVPNKAVLKSMEAQNKFLQFYETASNVSLGAKRMEEVLAYVKRIYSAKSPEAASVISRVNAMLLLSDGIGSH